MYFTNTKLFYSNRMLILYVILYSLKAYSGYNTLSSILTVLIVLNVLYIVNILDAQKC